MIFRDGATIKTAAAKFNINYSTAKSIVRQNGQQFNNGDWQPDQLNHHTKVSQRCSYKEIPTQQINFEPSMENTGEIGSSVKLQEFSKPFSITFKPIQIISRLEWNYIEKY